MTGVDSEIDELLAQALGRLGGPGARWVSRLLRRDTEEEAFELAVDGPELRLRVAELLAALGTHVVLSDAEGAGGQSALVGSGRGGLNPAVVTVWLAPAGPGRTAVRVRGVAKEGIVKQRGGAEVARRVAAALRQLESPPPAA